MMQGAFILQCDGCGRTFDWRRSELPDGPGPCMRARCWNRHANNRATWRVVKQHLPAGHVIVMGDRGWQQLHGPRFGENPAGWRAYPVELPHG